MFVCYCFLIYVWFVLGCMSLHSWIWVSKQKTVPLNFVSEIGRKSDIRRMEYVLYAAFIHHREDPRLVCFIVMLLIFFLVSQYYFKYIFIYFTPPRIGLFCSSVGRSFVKVGIFIEGLQGQNWAQVLTTDAVSHCGEHEELNTSKPEPPVLAIYLLSLWPGSVSAKVCLSGWFVSLWVLCCFPFQVGSEGGTAMREAELKAGTSRHWLGTDCAFHADLSKCPLLITRLSVDSF